MEKCRACLGVQKETSWAGVEVLDRKIVMQVAGGKRETLDTSARNVSCV